MSVVLLMLVIKGWCVYPPSDSLVVSHFVAFSPNHRECFYSQEYAMDVDGFWWSKAQHQDNDRLFVFHFKQDLQRGQTGDTHVSASHLHTLLAVAVLLLVFGVLRFSHVFARDARFG